MYKRVFWNYQLPIFFVVILHAIFIFGGTLLITFLGLCYFDGFAKAASSFHHPVVKGGIIGVSITMFLIATVRQIQED